MEGSVISRFDTPWFCPMSCFTVCLPWGLTSAPFEEGYKKSLERQEQGHIKIVSHAKVRNGHLHYDRKGQLR
mgnify:CR=1 FL=1